MTARKAFTAPLLLALTSCAATPPPASASASASARASAPASAAESALAKLLDEAWDDEMKEDPVSASAEGDHRYDALWPDASPAGDARRHAHAEAYLGRLRAIPREQLSTESKLDRNLFERTYAIRVEGWQYGTRFLALNQREGVQVADGALEDIRFEGVRDYEGWIGRLNALPGLLDDTTATLRAGIAAKIVQPRVTMSRVGPQIEKQLVKDPADSPFYAPFKAFPASVPEADRARLSQAAKAAITNKVLPAYAKFRDFFAKEYMPACYPEVGAWQLPNGAAAYAYLARAYTTTSATPEEIHARGLSEVARIHGEMQALMTKVGFKGSFADFFQDLRTNKKFFYASPEELLIAYRSTAKRIDPELTTEFKTLPRTPYGVLPIPDLVAPDTTTAYYDQGSDDGTRAGIFRVNLYKPEQRPKWEMMALALHESVPGHHLQIALSKERGTLKPFRRHAHWTAFVEGWGLYAESLGDEMGLYDDPYSKFGQLSYEMWRAVRLVVDTGMHAKHWTRDRAIAFFTENCPKAPLDIANEVDRYIAWPGQALAYKTGELKIKELRARAETKLAARFDKRAFHDAVLEEGAVPLDVLEAHIDAWIAAQLSAAK